MNDIDLFLTNTINSKSEKFSSVPAVFKGGSWKKDTDIYLNKIDKLKYKSKSEISNELVEKIIDHLN